MSFLIVLMAGAVSSLPLVSADASFPIELGDFPYEQIRRYSASTRSGVEKCCSSSDPRELRSCLAEAAEHVTLDEASARRGDVGDDAVAVLMMTSAKLSINYAVRSILFSSGSILIVSVE